MASERQLTSEICNDPNLNTTLSTRGDVSEANGSKIPTTAGTINGHPRLSAKATHIINGEATTKPNGNKPGDIITTIQSNHAEKKVSGEPSSAHDNAECENDLPLVENKPSRSVSEIVKSGLPFQPIERADLSNRLSVFDDFMFLIPSDLDDNAIVQVTTDPNENEYVNSNSFHDSSAVESIPPQSLSTIKNTGTGARVDDATKMHLSNVMLPVAPSVFEQQLQQIKINQKNKQPQQLLTTTIPNLSAPNSNFTVQPPSTSNLDLTKNPSTIFHEDGGEIVVDGEDISL